MCLLTHWDPGSPPSCVPAILLALSKTNLLRHAVALPDGSQEVGGGLCACAADVGEFPVLVECLCAQKGFVHTSLSLAEDDGWLVAGWCPSSRCVRAPCSHSLFYAD